jgi:RNA polymerase sigma factor (sigma-70 family)
MSEAAEAALRHHGDDLLCYFRRRVPDDDAADLLAETLTTAWRRVRIMPPDNEAARMWLFGIARNTLLNHQRGEQRQRRLADQLRGVLHTATPLPEADTGLEVRDAIERLPPDLAELVRLVHWEGLTIAQASEVMGLQASTARNHYQRAKHELRTALQAASLD